LIDLEAAPVQSSEWRVEVDLADPDHGYTLGERLRSLGLDEEARARLGERAIVTRDGARLFVYAADESSAREAKRVVRELLSEDELSAEVSLTRYHPIEEAWRDAEEPLPQSATEVQAEYERKEAAALREAEQTGHLPWEVAIELDSAERADALAAELEQAGERVFRRWRHVSVDVPTEERANELADELRARLGGEGEVAVQAHGVRYPVFTLLGSAG
jgi:hypothetical protein